MELNKQSRRRLRLQGLGFTLLFLAAIGLGAWLSTRYHAQADWTATGRHTLTEASVNLLASLEGPVTVTGFVRGDGDGARRAIIDFVGRYQKQKPDIALEFVNPDLNPDKVRSYGVTLEGEVVAEYHGRRENVRSLSEEEFTNALQRLARRGERRLLFVQGHGERKPLGQANHDLGGWGRQLENQGLLIGELNLAESPALPADTSVIVVAGPQVNLLPGEAELIRDHVAKGGNLLWLGDPGEPRGLRPLSELLGVKFHAGVVVDPTTQLLGIGDPTFAIVAEYPPHAMTEGLDSVTLFPTAVALQAEPGGEWAVEARLQTVARAWSEEGRLAGAVRFDAGKDIEGPLTVGVAMSRALKGEGGAEKQQRVVVMGDGDFLSNAFLGNGANLELGNRVVNWLTNDDRFIRIAARPAPDLRLELDPTLTALLGFGFLLVLPGGLLGSGLYIWMKRRKS